MNANNYAVKYTFAETYFQMGNYTKADALYQEVAKKVAGNPSFYYKVAESILKIENKNRASIYFEKALSSGQDFPERTSAEKQLHSLLYK
ncbi:hypothetical protein BMR02_12050 [Methylococcaceae bacterium HT1]|nr:hypothetical protein BMR02_12050 [Methylococcaceae bacterium HT1]